jgi:hypothetical protein
MEMCGPVNALAALMPVPTEEEAGWSREPVWKVLEKRKSLYLYQDLNHGPPSLYLVATLIMLPQSIPGSSTKSIHTALYLQVPLLHGL